MKCTNCGGRTKISEGIRKEDMSYRKRVCTKCGFSFYTKAVVIEEEVSDEAFEAIREYHREYSKLRYRRKKNEMS